MEYDEHRSAAAGTTLFSLVTAVTLAVYGEEVESLGEIIGKMR
jgi:hypothetical protein